MILSPSFLLPLIAEKQIVVGLSDRELTNPEGAGFDLRVASVNEITGRGSLLVDTRHTSPATEIAKFSDDTPAEIVSLEANKLYLLTTIETFKLSDDMMALFHPRSTLFRSGVIFQSGVAPYGYEGPMTFLLHIPNPAGFSLQIGARFAHVTVISVAGTSSPYRGQWQNGRVTTTIEEKQK